MGHESFEKTWAQADRWLVLTRKEHRRRRRRQAAVSLPPRSRTTQEGGSLHRCYRVRRTLTVQPLGLEAGAHGNVGVSFARREGVADDRYPQRADVEAATSDGNNDSS